MGNDACKIQFLTLTLIFLEQLKIESNTVFENRPKVSFNIASEASYVYILSGQKLMENAKNAPFWNIEL